MTAGPAPSCRNSLSPSPLWAPSPVLCHSKKAAWRRQLTRCDSGSRSLHDSEQRAGVAAGPGACCPCLGHFLPPSGRPPVPEPPTAGLLPVAPSWQSLGLGALHPGSVMGHGAPCPSLQESGQCEARGRAAQCTAGRARAPAAWAGQEASPGGGCGTRDLITTSQPHRVSPQGGGSPMGGGVTAGRGVYCWEGVSPQGGGSLLGGGVTAGWESQARVAWPLGFCEASPSLQVQGTQTTADPLPQPSPPAGAPVPPVPASRRGVGGCCPHAPSQQESSPG